MDPLGPVVLVVHLRNDDMRSARRRGKSRGACTAVMDDCCDMLEERLKVDLVDGEAAGIVVCQG
jgi:hypothetical protein